MYRHRWSVPDNAHIALVDSSSLSSSRSLPPRSSSQSMYIDRGGGQYSDEDSYKPPAAAAVSYSNYEPQERILICSPFCCSGLKWPNDYSNCTVSEV